MLLSNFNLLTFKKHSYGLWAEVDVTTFSFTSRRWRSPLVSEKTEHCLIHRPRDTHFWHFVETGKFTPLNQAEQLYAACLAKQELRLLQAEETEV